MSEERYKILQMVAEGKITPEEADRLLGAIKDSTEKGRYFRVRVFDRGRDKPKVKVDIPVGVIKLASKLSTVFKGVLPEGFKMNIKGQEIQLDQISPEMIDSIIGEITEGGKFTLVEVDDEDDNEHVEVYIE